ncbi:hypothetical protein Scep_023946 [Stephania cephalantha]|uniref:Uncharacterized protein n=1 Tax=Stephania cephalantha TaxID=152367 RepID=A0AAP0HXT4_9MAGN
MGTQEWEKRKEKEARWRWRRGHKVQEGLKKAGKKRGEGAGGYRQCLQPPGRSRRRRQSSSIRSRGCCAEASVIQGECCKLDDPLTKLMNDHIVKHDSHIELNALPVGDGKVCVSFTTAPQGTPKK